MKAIIQTRFGGPEVLQVREVPSPVPTEHEVLIRIHATTVAKEDPGARKSPGINGIFKPKNPIIGFYLAGEVVETGMQVTRFRVGDRVFGSPGIKLGTYAEYTCMHEDAALAIQPENLGHEESVALMNGPLTSIPFLRDKGQIKAGDSVLVNGASGTVGVSAVQLAKYFGAEVTGVCSTTNVELVRSLGAGHVIDYKLEDFTQCGRTFDIVFDTVAKSSFGKCKKILNPTGVYLSTGPSGVPASLMTRFSSGKKARFAATGLRKAALKNIDLEIIRTLASEGKYRPVIDRTYAMEDIADAHRYVEEGHKKGDVVIRIG